MKKNKNKSVKAVKRGRRSMKGKWGNVGAPPKTVKWPRVAFTMATLFNLNSKGGNAQCELSLRNKVDKGLADGTILALLPKKQPGGAVGRPKSVFVLKQFFVPSKHELSAKTVRVLRSAVTATPAAAPAQTAVPASPAPIEAPASPAPVIVEAPAAPVETVSTPAVTATPASPEPAIG